jgi:hypothetical protein
MSEIKIVEREVNPFLNKVKEIVVMSSKDMIEATEILSILNKYLDSVVSYREKKTKPLNELLKTIRLETKDLEKNLEVAIATVRSAVSTFMTAEAKRVKEAEAKIAARVGDGKGKFQMDTAARKMDAIVKPEEKVVAQSGMLKFRTVQRLSIVDAAAIPREYLVPDEKAILAALKEGKKIKGCVIIEEQSAVNYR